MWVLTPGKEAMVQNPSPTRKIKKERERERRYGLGEKKTSD
jgi:hypothetical protein